MVWRWDDIAARERFLTSQSIFDRKFQTAYLLYELYSYPEIRHWSAEEVVEGRTSRDSIAPNHGLGLRKPPILYSKIGR